MMFCFPAFGEYVFLKDGTIIPSKVISETDTQTKIQADGITRTIPRSEILRVRYDADFYNCIYLKKRDGGILSGYIVEDMADSYILREKLESPDEIKIEKQIILAVSKERFYSRGAYYSLGIIPGGSQIYVKKDMKGALFMGGNAAAWGFSGYSYYNYRKKKDEYESLGRGYSPSTYNRKYDNYKRSYQIFISSLIVSGLAYVAHWTDVILFSKPDFFNGGEVKKTAFFDFRINTPGISACRGKSGIPDQDTERNSVDFGVGLRF
jgi:hypothetical protein